MSPISHRPESVTLKLDTTHQAARPGDDRIVNFVFGCARDKWPSCSLELKRGADPNVWYFIGARRIVAEARSAIHYLNVTPCAGLVDPTRGLLEPQELQPDALPESTVQRFEHGQTQEPLLPWGGFHPEINI